MKMYNPAHPGEMLRQWIPEDMTVAQVAAALQVKRSVLSKVLDGKSAVTADLALRLAAWLGTSAETWVHAQAQWDIWRAIRQPRRKIKPLRRTT